MTDLENDPNAEGKIINWFTALGWWSRFGLALLAGAAMTAGHPPIGFPWTMFVGVPVIVLLATTAPTPRTAAWAGWAAGFGYFLTGLHWTGHAFLVDPEKFAWLLPLGVTVLPIGLSLFWAIAFWLARRLHPGSSASAICVLICLWTLAEFARGNVLTGLPWGLPGYVWVDLPPMQAAAWIGPWGMSFLTLLLGAVPAVAVRPGVLRWAAPIAALVVGSGIWLAGNARLDPATQNTDLVVRLVQPNAPQHLKWQPGYREQFYQRALDATAAAPDPDLGPPDVVIWPEVAVYFVPEANPAEVARISEAAGDAAVLLGALHGVQTDQGPRWTNAMVSILPDGTLGPRYDKHHLVPFGEYMPMKPLMDALGLTQLGNGSAMAPGPGPRTLTVGDLPPLTPLICYEAIFPHEIGTGQRPAWLVQPTNDAWFGNWAGPLQHYAQARIRAIERGLPMVRAANTGISAIVDSRGTEIVSIPLNTASHIDAFLPAPMPPTLYSWVGDWPYVALIVLLCLFLVISKFRRPRR